MSVDCAIQLLVTSGLLEFLFPTPVPLVVPRDSRTAIFAVGLRSSRSSCGSQVLECCGWLLEHGCALRNASWPAGLSSRLLSVTA